jgi:hypothetical protein
MDYGWSLLSLFPNPTLVVAESLEKFFPEHQQIAQTGTFPLIIRDQVLANGFGKIFTPHQTK